MRGSAVGYAIIIGLLGCGLIGVLFGMAKGVLTLLALYKFVFG